MDHPVVYDIEVYRNYFLAAFKSLKTGKVLTYERGMGLDFQREEMLRIFRNCTTIGFNSISYDLVVTFLAMAGLSTEKLKEVSDKIIVQGVKHWAIEREYGIRIPKGLDHIDLIEVAPGKASLKIYGGRLHAKRMQDLPFDPDADLTADEIAVLKHYCVNDLDTTARLFEKLRPQLELRAQMSAEYEEELRSKSDAQIAEVVIKKQVGRLSGTTPERPSLRPGTTYRYNVPDFIRFELEPLRDMLGAVRDAVFEVTDSGKVDMPAALDKAKISIGGGVYRMGIGGLHSSEVCTAHFSDDETMLIDRDVASYYPAIILNLGLAPRHMGGDFLKVYQGIVERRLAAKKAGNKVVAESLKITINGSFGKFGSKWSTLYSPDLMTQVTITGQLSLLLLIERFELAGIPIVSANTDGLVIKCPRARAADMAEIVAQWESDTGFATEDTEYRALYSRDVNNYVGVKTDGSTKRKGAFAESGLQKNPTNEICVEAAINCLVSGTPVADTIKASEDIRQFVTVRTVKGGAFKGSENRYLGKAIRWYYGRYTQDAIYYKTNGNKVPRSDGAVPLMELPDSIPDDLNRWWYVREAASLLRDLGYRGPVDRTLDLL